MDRSDRKERLEARRDALPADDQATILLLKPSKCPLSLEPRDYSFDRSATVFLGLPDPPRTLINSVVSQEVSRCSS